MEVKKNAAVTATAPAANTAANTAAQTPGISAKAKEALKKYQEEAKEAKTFLRECLMGQHNDLVIPDKVLKAISVLVPLRKPSASTAAPRNQKKVVLDALNEMFGGKVGATITLMDVFKRFRMGEGEMRVRMRNAILDRKPEERMWITYDQDSETYTLAGYGKDAPKGWTGVMPKVKVAK